MDHILTAVLSPAVVTDNARSPQPATASVLHKRLKVAINPNLINKNELGDTSLFAKGWANQELTPRQLADQIDQGMAYTCQLSGTRKAENFLCSDVISVDFDGTRDIMEFIEDPIVKRCMTIFYPTPSHTGKRHRFRAIFATSRTITSATEMKAAMRSLTLRLGGDPSATDAARIFYGSRGSRPRVFDRCIDDALLEELITQGVGADQSDTKGGSPVPTISRQVVAPDQIILTGDGKQLPFAEIETGRAVCCPFHYDQNASAFIVRSRTGTKGLHCSTCCQTFWPFGSGPPAHDFFEFDECVYDARRYFQAHKDPGPLGELFPTDHPIHTGLMRSNISVSTDQYLRIEKLHEGITFVKSPKGTGKTEVLRGLVSTGSTLLIGHRITLIRQSCTRLGLKCYLDFDGWLWHDRLGICLDSLQRLQAKLLRYDTIILDESEQVLSHFLSDTIPSEKRDAIFVIFRTLLSRAKRVVALDADLGWLTFETLTKANGIRHRPSYIYLNEFPAEKPIEVYDSDRHLLAELKQHLQDRKRVFVTSNSKRRIDDIEAVVANELEGVRVIKITSDTVGAEVSKSFVANPAAQALHYDLILTSPSLGTGVDITFDDQQQLIDAVFGFFEARITTHFDIDQQLARVRQPGCVKVWVSPQTFRFDTAQDVVKADLRRSGVYKNFLDRFDDHGTPQYVQDDPFLDLASLVISLQRASKNNLKHHFIQLKRRQGYIMKRVPADDSMREEGKQLARLGRQLNDRNRAEMLMQAKPLRKAEYEALEARLSENDEVSNDEKWSMRRTNLERFHREKIDPKLIELDDYGRLRRRVVRFENLLSRSRMSAGTGDTPGSWRSAIESSPALAAQLRFVKNSRDEISLLYDLLHTTPLMANGEWTQATLKTADLAAFAHAMKKDKSIIENVLEIEVRGDVEKKPVTQLNAVLKLVGLKCKLVRREKVKGHIIYRYGFDQGLFDCVTDLVEKRASTDSWEALYDIHGWDKAELMDDDSDIDWDALQHLWKKREVASPKMQQLVP